MVGRSPARGTPCSAGACWGRYSVALARHGFVDVSASLSGGATPGHGGFSMMFTHLKMSAISRQGYGRIE